ncbi:MAG: hypothetical protein DWQ04_30055 [Chloroflexi bacterium]|nr:MAG: hypothetical protein DWQ04_30055 [Chloroflexota bacterium]
MNVIRNQRFVLFFVVAAFLMGTTACATVASPGAVQTKSETVELGSADSVRVSVDAGIGELYVEAGASELLNADFRYNIDELEPDVTYDVDDDTGRLRVFNKDNINVIPTGEVESEWRLQFAEDVPLEMNLNLGLGDSDMDLSDLIVTSLEVSAGAGRLDLNVGNQTLDRLRVEAGLGDVKVDVAGGTIGRFDYQSGAGSTRIDLRGAWEDDLVATIEGGLGDLTVIVPRDTGVRIEVNLGLGDINADGFRIDGSAYVNDAYENGDDVTLSIDIQGGAGSVTLEMGE